MTSKCDDRKGRKRSVGGVITVACPGYDSGIPSPFHSLLSSSMDLPFRFSSSYRRENVKPTRIDSR